MSHPIIWLTWAFWLPTALLEKAAQGDSRGTSILPVFPTFPIVGSLPTWGLNQGTTLWGDYLVGGLHGILLLLMLVSCVPPPTSGCSALHHPRAMLSSERPRRQKRVLLRNYFHRPHELTN